MIFAFADDATLVTALGSLAAFTASLIWWILKSQERRHQEELELRTRQTVAQEDQNHKMGELAKELHDHMAREEERSLEMKHAMEKQTAAFEEMAKESRTVSSTTRELIGMMKHREETARREAS